MFEKSKLNNFLHFCFVPLFKQITQEFSFSLPEYAHLFTLTEQFFCRIFTVMLQFRLFSRFDTVLVWFARFIDFFRKNAYDTYRLIFTGKGGFLEQTRIFHARLRTENRKKGQKVRLSVFVQPTDHHRGAAVSAILCDYLRPAVSARPLGHRVSMPQDCQSHRSHLARAQVGQSLI